MPELYGPFFGDYSPLNLPTAATPPIVSQQQQGFLGRLGNALTNPGPLGQMGAYMMAASGAPLGHALLGMQQYKLQERLQEEEAAARKERLRQQQERIRLEQESLDLRRNTPLSTQGKLRSDLDAGRITPEQYQSAMSGDLVRVADGSSPTGYSYKPKFQAAGLPAPASGMALSVGPDGSVQFTQGGGKLDMSKGEAEKLRTAEIATRNFVATVGDALTMIQKYPDINTFTARGASLVNNLQQEAKAIAGALGKQFDERTLDPSAHAETFDRLGIENARMRGLITALAFQAAAASNQSGRDVTEKDVRRFIEEVGASSSDPRAFAQTLQDVANRTVRNFQINYQVRMGQPFSGDIQVPSMPKQRYKYNPETGELE